MKRSEVSELLAFIASVERNGWQVEPTDVEEWKMFADEGRWPSFEVARRAYVTYRSRHPDFPLRPGHITQVIEQVRARARAELDPSGLRVPDDAKDDLAAYQRWVAGLRHEHETAALSAFVAGTPQQRQIGTGAR